MSSFVEIHPDSQEMLRQAGLVEPADFLRLTGVILGGHPDRHVLRVQLAGATALVKKEHRVSWRSRLNHWWHGHGAVSNAVREGRMLRELAAVGIGCPVVMAYGEAGGQSFLLMREEPELTELRTYLRDHPLERLALAEALGKNLARLHAAGFHHRDLYSKHVFVRRSDQGWHFSFIDWQRGRRVKRLPWRHRLCDLAALDATLADVLASRRERLRCWASYLAAQDPLPLRPQKLMRQLCRISAQLRRKRRIRELRQLPLPADQQQLIWLDGEALCVTPHFQRLAPKVPDWLAMPQHAGRRDGVEMVELAAGPSRNWRLMRRWTWRPWHSLVSWLRRRPPFPAPEFEQAAALIRMERFGVGVPRLLALGHRHIRAGQKYSFLLTESPADAVPLVIYLNHAPPAQRRAVLRDAGLLLRRIHEAGYAWRGQGMDGWAVQPSTGAVVLTSVHHLERQAGHPDQVARKNLAQLVRTSITGIGAADKLRFFLGYHGADKLTAAHHHRLARKLAVRHRKYLLPRKVRVAG